MKIRFKMSWRQKQSAFPWTLFGPPHPGPAFGEPQEKFHRIAQALHAISEEAIG